MKYGLGQIYEPSPITPTDDSSYCHKENVGTIDISVEILGHILTNKGIILSNGESNEQSSLPFLKDTSYFLTFSINLEKKNSKEKIPIHKVKLVLKTENGDSQFLKEIECNSESHSFSIVISPKNNFSYLEFELERLNVDPIVVNLTNVELYSFENKCNSAYKRIGLQAEPGSIFTINNEEVRMGKTGMFEFKNDNVPIYSFCCIKAEKGFILDYIEMTKE